ncbi:MAG: PhoD-like phosphatase, partial [Microcoleus sp.]
MPLILAGPILRRTETGAVTVWLALKAPREVELKVYSTEGGTGEVLGAPLLQGTNTTVAIGKYLHVVAVTAKPTDSKVLTYGQIYAYDIEFAASPDSPSEVAVPENEKENLLSCLWPASPDL